MPKSEPPTGRRHRVTAQGDRVQVVLKFFDQKDFVLSYEQFDDEPQGLGDAHTHLRNRNIALTARVDF